MLHNWLWFGTGIGWMDRCSLWVVAGGGRPGGTSLWLAQRETCPFLPHLCVILQILEGSCHSQATPDSRRPASFASRGWRPTLAVDSQSDGAQKN
jgi:hypothetical protein